MSIGDIEVKKADTIFDELDWLHQAISRRADDPSANSRAADLSLDPLPGEDRYQIARRPSTRTACFA